MRVQPITEVDGNGAGSDNDRRQIISWVVEAQQDGSSSLCSTQSLDIVRADGHEPHATPFAVVHHVDHNRRIVTLEPQVRALAKMSGPIDQHAALPPGQNGQKSPQLLDAQRIVAMGGPQPNRQVHTGPSYKHSVKAPVQLFETTTHNVALRALWHAHAERQREVELALLAEHYRERQCSLRPVLLHPVLADRPDGFVEIEQREHMLVFSLERLLGHFRPLVDIGLEH